MQCMGCRVFPERIHRGGAPLLLVAVKSRGTVCFCEISLTHSLGSSRQFGRSGETHQLRRRETRVRGPTTHSRRDPRNAKGVGRIVWDPFCTGAQEVGKMSGAATCWVSPLRAGRRCVSPAVTSAAPRLQKSHATVTRGRRCVLPCGTQCSARTTDTSGDG